MSATQKRFPYLEITLIEFIIYLLLWFWDGYIAFFLTLLFSGICLFILILALIAEAIERSKVPRSYFYAMAILGIVPWFTAGLAYLLNIGAVDLTF